MRSKMQSTELEDARSRFEAEWQGLRRQMDDRLGLKPRQSAWWLVLLAGALGLALAGRARARRAIGEETGGDETTRSPRDA